MQTLDLIQGSDAWRAARTNYFCASEAAAMLGFSPNLKRNELLHMKASLSEQAFSDWVQKFVLDKGHEVEALARPLAEGIMGEDLYPATCVKEVEGLRLLASYDGITMDESLSWENKQFNRELRDYILERGDVPDSHWPQLEHQAIVGGVDKILFTVSDGTEDTTEHVWYESRPERRSQVIAGWKQFAKDVAEYQPVHDAPKPEGRAPENLPALLIEVTGMVTASNLAAFKDHALTVFGGIKTDLQTDADFSDAEKTVKWCGEVEDRLEAAKQHALSQTASIDELFRTIDAIKAEARAKRLELDKLVKARKEAIRTDLVMGAQRKLQEHIAAANAALGKPYISASSADFAAAIKSLKTISSLRNALDTALAAAKVVVDQAAEKVRSNLAILRELAADHAFLFADVAGLVLKAPDDLTAIVKSRIAEHKAAEERRLEAERERIRQEEAAKLQREQAAKESAEREAQRQAEAAAQKAAQPNPAPTATTPGTAVTPMAGNQEAAQQDTGATMKLGEICTRLGFTVTADFLSSIGFQPAGTERAAKLYRAAAFPLICAALVRHINAVVAVIDGQDDELRQLEMAGGDMFEGSK